MEEKELKELLLREKKEFRDIFKKHQQCEKKLERLKKKTFLTEQERINERELKKRKLAFKDRMYVLMAEYRKSHR
jgi:uncharacterized protein YdcH (DUF465 family)